MKSEGDNGKALENAVRLIQETLLQSDPNLKGGQFTIELNKRVTVNNTRHEIDVYVVTRPGTSYESIVLFECKDCAKPVSKNVVMNLKEKVDLLGATRGILVASQLSRDAEALLSQYTRVEYRRCSDDIANMLIADVVHTIHDPLSITVRVRPRDPARSFPANLKECLACWNGRISFLQALGYERVEIIAKEDKIAQSHKYDTESVHWYHACETLEFSPGEFSLGGIEVECLETHVAFFVTIVRNSPVYQCSINGDGHLLSYQIIDRDFASGKLDVNVVLTERQKPRN